MAPYDPNIDLSNPRNDANGNLVPSSIYKGASSIDDMYSNINVRVNRLNNNKKLTKEDRNFYIKNCNKSKITLPIINIYITPLSLVI